ncbi:hypothetical protein H9L13_00390 [Sphingomonas lutea]|uniref:Uncharacterized protein n=1 Tax=Sphingomonas lutea TaxID=1045317 RepID=A0A7G9SHZ5_9SPHN|nr:hypothetical protein [Sphingomonas lutea]QNN67470.1 hypothetical protein H9L13_00390 [Sphingomonas lutea]
MNSLWSYFWPLFALGLVLGAIARTTAYRHRLGRRALVIGGAVALAATAAWHMYAAPPFVASVERTTRQALTYYEMARIDARLQRGPLTRDLLLRGQADDWQRGELVRVLSQVPGVGKARWGRNPYGIPMILEGIGATLLGFLLGMALGYLVEWHRRHNAQWSW